MKLCVFETGLPPEVLTPQFDRYPVMIRDWLSPALPEAEFTYVSVVTGESLPDVDAFDGYLITGSRYGVYEDLPWMVPLKTFLQSCKTAAKPVFGICFGHQIMAEAYGGKVVKSDKGWQIGAKAYTHLADGMTDQAAHAFHQDQIVEQPPHSRIVGDTAQCAMAALEYDFPALSVQYHPEFRKPYMDALMNLHIGGKIPESVRDSVETHAVDNGPCAVWAAAFFRKYSDPVAG